jgi:hypothetical protein
MNLDNEPNFQVPWTYNYLGAPDKTSKAVDKATQTLFGYLPNNAEPGNDDLGALANWFVWSALGMYPMTPGTGVLALNAPMFDRSVVELGNGRTVTINAEGAQSPTRAWDSENKYIAGMRLNGGPTTKNWIEYSDLTAGATIDYEIVTDTVPAWGTADADLPPSWRGGNGIVANVTPEAGPVTGALSVAPGGTVGGTLDVQRIDSSVTTFTATIVTSHPGIVADEVAPASIDEHGFGTTPISFAVDAGVASGYYSATVTARAGTATYAKDLIIRVAKPGSLEAAKTIIGTSTRQATKGSFDGGNGYGSPGAQGFGINEGATEVNTYSRDELAKIGFTPGSVHTYEAGDIELTFEWPTAPAGYPDAYAPDGQTITLDSPTTALSFIGAAHNGRTVYRGDGATGTATVHLWDGTAATTATADLSFGHWLRPSAEGTEAGGHLEPNHGNTKVAWLAHRNPLEREYNSGAANNIEGSYLFGTIPYAAPAGSVITAVTFPTAATVRVFAIAHSGRTIGVGETVSNVATGFVPVTATGFASGEDVTVSIDTAPVSTTVVQADDFGAIDARAAIAPGVAPGAYTVTLTAYSYPDAEALSAPVQVDTLASTRTREAAGAIVGTYALPEGAVERYTPDSYAVLAAALADARGLLALSDPISAESITAVLAALETATAGLVDAVDMSPLTQLIAAAQAVIANPDGYVAQNMPALIAAVAQAQLKAADPDITQEEICVVALQLTRAMASVHPKGDKAPLVALLRFVVALDSSRYTPASWEGVDIAIAVADGVVANEQVSIDDVEEAFTALVDAVGGLTLRAAKAGLGSVIVVAETIIAEADLYVPASLVGLSVALTTAQAVFADPNAAAADVSAVRQALVAQIALARLRPASSPDSSSIEVLASVASAGDVTPSAVPPAVEPVGGSVAPPATAAGSALAPAPAAPIAKKAFRSAAKPVVSGTAKVGRKLVVKTGGWSPKPKLSYQWYRNGKAIAKATKVTYRLTAKDKGKRISVKVTAKKAGYRTLVKASAKTSRIA